MVCDRCGAQVAPVDNFCRNCGVRFSQSAGITAADASSRTEREQPINTAASSSRAKSVPSGARRDAALPPAHERKGTHSTTIFFGLVLLIAIAAAGVYFGTDLLREPGKPDRPFGADAPGAGEPVDSSPTPFAQSQRPAVAVGSPRVVRATARMWFRGRGPIPKHPSLLPVKRRSKPTSNNLRVPRVRPRFPLQRRHPGALPELERMKPETRRLCLNRRLLLHGWWRIFPRGTRVEVVSSKGDWLEVHSRRGNPPGFIRRQDAKFLEKTD